MKQIVWRCHVVVHVDMEVVVVAAESNPSAYMYIRGLICRIGLGVPNDVNTLWKMEIMLAAR